MLPLLTLIARRRGVDGHAELAAAFLHPGAVAGDVQRRHDRLRARVPRRAACCDAGARRSDRRSSSSRSARCSAASRSSRCSGRRCGARASAIGRCSTGRIRACGACSLLMGPGTIGLAATQVNLFVNTVLATGEGTGARVVAELRIPADVPADRPVRRLDRHGDAAGGVAARRRRGHARPAARRSPTACR